MTSVRYDPDCHAMEPQTLWPEAWKDRWPDTSEFPAESYLRKLDESGCDVGIVLPTRCLFMQDFDLALYGEWVQEFCAPAKGRLLPATLYAGGEPAEDARVFVAMPAQALELVQLTRRPVIVHSCAQLRYSTNLIVDQACNHTMDAMLFLAELATRPQTQCQIAILEGGAWWADRWYRHLDDRGIGLYPGNIFLGASRPQEVGNGNRVLLGSDHPHFDAINLADVPRSIRELAWENAGRFMGGN